MFLSLSLFMFITILSLKRKILRRMAQWDNSSTTDQKGF